jgi:ATP-dependent RNA helicase SUPV3L1/SUV3
MLNAQPSQFKLAVDGSILYQPDASNPQPGSAIAKIRKGRSPIAPEIDISDGASQDKNIAKEFLAGWLKNHINEILAPLVALEDIEKLAGPARGICFQLFEAMGIVPRESLEDLIGGLDSEMRQALRAKQVRLGPLLVFLPALNKPAGVRLRGLLWSLWNDKPLPAPVPADGIMSLKVDPGRADRRFYQAVGYPIFGPRAVRIDMLDRVISAVYDNAKEGKFRAEHKMAEWLGVPIDDLYAILEAMGHRKIAQPVSAEEPTAEEVVKELAMAEKKPDVKPELAQFYLKKGKAFEKPKFKKEQSERPKKNFKKDKHKKPHEPKIIQATVKSKPEDSPFAILEQLKVKKDAAGS